MYNVYVKYVYCYRIFALIALIALILYTILNTFEYFLYTFYTLQSSHTLRKELTANKLQTWYKMPVQRFTYLFPNEILSHQFVSALQKIHAR